MKLEGKSQCGEDAYRLGLEASKGDMNKTQGTLTILLKRATRVISPGTFLPLAVLFRQINKGPTLQSDRLPCVRPRCCAGSSGSWRSA